MPGFPHHLVGLRLKLMKHVKQAHKLRHMQNVRQVNQQTTNHYTKSQKKQGEFYKLSVTFMVNSIFSFRWYKLKAGCYQQVAYFNFK